MVIFNHSYCANIYILELYLASFWALVRSLGPNWPAHSNSNTESALGSSLLVLVHTVEGTIPIWPSPGQRQWIYKVNYIIYMDIKLTDQHQIM